MKTKTANAQKNTLLKNAQANAESNFFKRVFFSPPKKEFQNIFSNASKKNKTRKRTDQHDKENDAKTQQRQWFTDTVDKNASW